MSNPLRRVYKGLPRLRRLTRRIKHTTTGALVSFALWLVGRLPLERALRVGEVTGGLLYRVLRRPRRLAREHLRLAFGDGLTPAAAEHLARASFINIARCFCELAKIDAIHTQRDRYFETSGWEHLENVLAAGKGAIVVTGHIGNWELLGAYCAWRGMPMAVIARRIYAPRLNQLLVDFRSRQGVQTILRESPHSASEILRALKTNALLTMVIDQDTHAASMSVPFFGRLARTPAAAAALAIRRDLPAIAGFIGRRPEGGHRITIKPPFVIQRSADMRADIRALTVQFSAAIQVQVRHNPAEWVWWHRRRRAPLPHLDQDGDFQYTSQDTVLRGRG